MQKLRQPLLAFALFALCSSPGFSQKPTTIDFTAASNHFKQLRESYAKAQPGAISWVSNDERTKLLKLYDEAEPSKFLSAVEPWLLKCPVDARAYVMAASLSAKIGKFEDSIRYRNHYYELLASIVNSGDGRSAATAFKVIAIDEEYTLLNYMGADRKKQSLQGVCDVMDVEIEGKPMTIYFDVSIHLKGLQREFEPTNTK